MSKDKTRAKRFVFSKRAIIISVAVAVLAIATLALFMFMDELPIYRFELFVPDEGTALAVTLEIDNPLFSKTSLAQLYIGDKDITIVACVGPSGQPSGRPVLDEGVLYIETGRGSKTYLTYAVEIATPGKHGNRGGINDGYAVFDGEQALLLPVSVYTYRPGSDRLPLMGEISFSFFLPDTWEQVVARDTVKNPCWPDIYAITQDAFVFGDFAKSPNTPDGLDVFTLSGSEPLSQVAIDGINGLYSYYSDLFASTPKKYSVVALPEPDDGALKIIGGAGTGSVAASFDPDLTRDWQLLSHRMFHAFFDSSAPYATFHMAPNTWFYEGLATYYENMSMAALPSELKTRLDINVGRQMALLFNNYLYMRIKDPATFSFPPMREDELALEAAIEFLHYTTAPLIVNLLENMARDKGCPPDAALKFCVDNGDKFDELFVSFEAIIETLGEEDAEAFCGSYLLSVTPPPLWDLKQYLPSDEAILAGLNDVEYVLGTWLKNNDENYHIDTVTYKQLTEAIENLNEKRALFLSVETSVALEDYCLPLYALLNDYYYRAKEKGISYDDPELRYKVFSDD
ncbi:MAG: hypothetical protein FWH57_04175 [Oscillospiraceae bacterium]|nr:hypothetical protein [Oscillospiraceae bacterium]